MLLIVLVVFPFEVMASTATITFTPPPSGAETWVFVGTEDCGVVAGVMADKMLCPYGKIGVQGATSVQVGNVPPGQTIYATAKHVWRETGVESTYAAVVSSLVPPLPLPTEPVPFPVPVIIQWPSGTMTITHQ